VGKAIMLAVALLPAAVLATVPGTAAAAGNSSSTHQYITADYAFSKASIARLGTMRASASAAKRGLLSHCGNAAAGSPQNEQSYALSYEAAGVLWSAAYGADARPIAALAHRIGALRWSNPKLTRLAHSYAASLQALAHLRPPDVCADIAAWKRSGYTQLPAHVKQFQSRVEPIEVSPVPRRLLASSEQPGDATLLHRTEALQERLLVFETFVGGNDWYDLTEGLGLNP
jgi:hypothetical protein